MSSATPASIEHRASVPLPAPVERAFRALVDPAQLARWFAEEVRIEPAVGGGFSFHGRGAFGTPGAATQTITAFEPGRALAFRWSIHGIDSEVRWTIVPGTDEPDTTSQIEVAHDVFGALPFRNARHVIDDLWRLHTGNLREHLGGGSTNVVLADFATTAPEVRVSIEIAAPPAKVYRALLDPALMNRWLGGTAAVDVERRTISYGWSYTIEGRAVEGGPTRILELVENRRLVTDWPDWRGDPDQPSTRVTWELEPLAGGAHTRVTIIHDGFALPVDRSDYQQGWAGFADELKKVVEAEPAA